MVTVRNSQSPRSERKTCNCFIINGVNFGGDSAKYSEKFRQRTEKMLIGKKEIESHLGNLHIRHSHIVNIHLGCQTIPNHYHQYLVLRE